MQPISAWRSVVTGFGEHAAALPWGALEWTLVGLALAACLLLVACALGVRRAVRELAATREEIARAGAGLRDAEDPLARVLEELARIRERLDHTVPPEIHVDSIVARQLEVRPAPVNGAGRPNLIVHDFE